MKTVIKSDWMIVCSLMVDCENCSGTEVAQNTHCSLWSAIRTDLGVSCASLVMASEHMLGTDRIWLTGGWPSRSRWV